jgi:hypothetical protein
VEGLDSSVLDEYTATPKISLTWDREIGVTYTLKRATLTYTEENATLINPIPADFAPVQGVTILVATTHINAGTWEVVDGTVEARKSYRYEVVATKGSLTSDPAYEDVENGPFSLATYIDLSSSSSYISGAAGSTQTVTFTFTPSGGGYYGHNLIVELWKRKLGATAYDYVFVGRKTLAGTTTGSTPTAATLDEDVTAADNGSYNYKIVVRDKANDGVILENNSSATTDINVTISITP